MKTYLLFLYGIFEEHEDVENFCFDVIGKSPLIKSVKFIIENKKGIVVILESESERKELSNELVDIISNDIVKFYFLFDRDSLYSANLPLQMKNFIFDSTVKNKSLVIEFEKNVKTESETKSPSSMDLDTILEKIAQDGFESLTEDEKNFLDNFEN